MKYTKIKEEAYNLHIIKTNKFKKNVIKVNFKNRVVKENIVKRRLIPNILSDSNAIYPTIRLLNIKTEELYNLMISGNVTQSGNSIITSFTATFLNDKYAPGLLKDAVSFVSNIIFNPIVIDNHFDDKAFKHSCELLKEEIELYNENPGSYALEETLKELGPNTPLAYPIYGTVKEIDSTLNTDVYKYYLDMINTDAVDIFIIGDIDDSVKDIIKEAFKNLKHKRVNTKHYIEHKEFNDEYREIKKVKPYNQSKLIIGYKLGDLTDYEKEYVLPIYSYILGGGPDSRLFSNVREKNSLCYSISSSVRIVSNIMLITSGINASSYKKALKLIKEEVDNMAKGNFNNKDIEKAKITYLSAYEEVNDSIYSILNDYNTHEYLKTDLVNIRKKKIVEVTKKDIMKVIPKIHPEIVYLLEGSKDDGKENS
ncbi:MAG: insulinase family protein [Bacilli bacterium]|nr:insulinase family protein [Bacilli bacterium]